MKNKTVELVNAWAAYEEDHPDASIDDFCHFYITSKRVKQKSKAMLGGIVPPDAYSSLAKMIGRLSKLNNTYSVIALKECGLDGLDEFLYLNSIGRTEAPKKTTIIYSNFNELSSGLLILDRLKKRGLVLEEDDNEDKRSRRLKLSKKGTALLKDCYKKMAAINEWFFNDISTEDANLCVHLLSSIEVKFAASWLQDKTKSFDSLIE